MSTIFCPVCEYRSVLLDVVDFNKSCEERRNRFLPLSAIPIYYYLCQNCSFCFAPEFFSWTEEDFQKKIYNASYIEVDPDYESVRPQANAQWLLKRLPDDKKTIRHVDFGGGNGVLSNLLHNHGWCNSYSYDPYENGGADFPSKQTFDLITAYEVFEHVCDIHTIVKQMKQVLSSSGVIIFSTLVSDGHIGLNQRINWWYASPRNGHISLFSKRSLQILAEKNDFFLGSFSPGLHMLYQRHVDPYYRHFFTTKNVAPTGRSD